MKNATRYLLALLVLGVATAVEAEDFFPISSVTTSTMADDLWPASNLIQGPGVGFDAAAPHDKILDGQAGNWVTAACAFPCDYLEVIGIPVIELDLGAEVDLTAISMWGYAVTNSNGMKDFSLRFATEADGPAGFGTSITFNPTYGELPNEDNTSRFTFSFGQLVTARYVEVTTVDNHFIAPGDDSLGNIPGGDRVGLGEIAFPIRSAVFGDANGDNVVDFLDFEIIRDNFLTGTTLETGDVTFDGIVNFDDFALWKANFSPGGAAVPEPATAGLCLLAVALLSFGRRSRRRIR